MCTWKCDAGFKLNKKGKHNICKCKHHKKRGTKCAWKKPEDANDKSRWCAPKPKFFKKLDRQVKKATRKNDQVLLKKLDRIKADALKWKL